MVAIRTEVHLLRLRTRGSLATDTSDSGTLPQSKSLTEPFVEGQMNLLERMFMEQTSVDVKPDLAELAEGSSQGQWRA